MVSLSAALQSPTIGYGDLYELTVDRELTAAQSRLPAVTLDAEWLAADPNATEVYLETHPCERGVEDLHVYVGEPLSERRATIPGVQNRTIKKHSVAPRTDGCTNDHVHDWYYAGKLAQQSGAVDLPYWDYGRCVDPLLFKCGRDQLDRSRVFLKPCGSNDARACPPCERRYRNRVKVIVVERLKVARKGSTFFLTLTAPGVQRHCWAHPYLGKDGKQHPSVRCYEGDGKRTAHDWCPCTTDATALTDRGRMASWNLTANARYNDFMTDLRRSVAGFEAVAYFKAAEVQERGALHFHIVLELRAGLLIVDDDKLAELKRYAIHHGFGCTGFDLQQIGDSEQDQLKAARYVAKYVTKTNEGKQAQLAVPVRTQYHATNRPGLDDWVGAPAHQQSDARRRFLYRAWTASRNWRLSMARVIELQRIYRTEGEAAAKLQLPEPRRAAPISNRRQCIATR